MEDLAALQSIIVDKTAYINQRKGEKQSLVGRRDELQETIDHLTAEAVTTEKAVWLLQSYAEAQQKEVIEKVENIVTSGLRAVFQNETLSFVLSYSQNKAGGRTKTPEVTMAVYYDYGGEEVKGDIRNSFGGGLSVVVSVLLRVVVTIFLGERVRPILFLDEALKDLSPEYADQDSAASGYRDRMAEFLKKLTQEVNVQIIFVTHEPNYSAVAEIDHRFFGSIGKSPRVKTHTELEIDQSE